VCMFVPSSIGKKMHRGGLWLAAILPKNEIRGFLITGPQLVSGFIFFFQ
jgi:hypothetical protein